MPYISVAFSNWTVACQSPLSMGFSRQEYCSGLPYPTPGDLPDPGIETVSLKSPALASMFFTTSGAWVIVVNIMSETLFSPIFTVNTNGTYLSELLQMDCVNYTRGSEMHVWYGFSDLLFTDDKFTVFAWNLYIWNLFIQLVVIISNISIMLCSLIWVFRCSLSPKRTLILS